MSASDSDYPGAEYGYGPKRRGCGAALFQAFVFILVILGLGVVALFFGPPVIADYLKFSLRNHPGNLPAAHREDRQHQR